MDAISDLQTWTGTIHGRFFTILVTPMTRWHRNQDPLIMMGMVNFDRRGPYRPTVPYDELSGKHCRVLPSNGPDQAKLAPANGDSAYVRRERRNYVRGAANMPMSS